MFKALKEKFFGANQSKSLAKSRLHFVLVQDRAGLSNEEMAAFKSELVEVIESYFVIDKQGFDIDYERNGDSTTLLINSPVVVRRQEGLHGQVGVKHDKGGSRKKRKDQRTSQQTANA
jgi:cell division topological specificity factor